MSTDRTRNGGPSILAPGGHRATGLADDAAVIDAMLRVEAAWAGCLAEGGAATGAQARLIADTCTRLESRTAGGGATLATASSAESAGNPVVPVVRALRAEVGLTDPAAADLVHRGLTSQDVLDTALMTVAGEVLEQTAGDLLSSAAALADLARIHTNTVMVGRTLTQPAVPITFGYKAARWLSGILDALEMLDAARQRIPVQCGGAAGTLSLAAILMPDPLAAVSGLAWRLGLADPGVPWHTNRIPVTRLGDALVTTCGALGVLAADVATLSRPEIGELREGAGSGRGGSSTMPHKRNPVLSVLIRSAAMRAPLLGATLHQAAGQAVDERPDGAWHAEWPSLRDLLVVTATAASQVAELVAHLEVNTAGIGRNVAAYADSLLAEPNELLEGLRENEGTVAALSEPAGYLGSTSTLVDRVLARYTATTNDQTTHGEK